jgi:hypothetical protein
MNELLVVFYDEEPYRVEEMVDRLEVVHQQNIIDNYVKLYRNNRLVRLFRLTSLIRVEVNRPDLYK